MPQLRQRQTTRLFNGDIQRSDKKERTYILSFSSEDPDTSRYTPEIMDHAEGAADLSRLNEMGVVLFNHDVDRVVGKVVRAWIENGRGQAEIQFDGDPESQIIEAKVQSGTLKGVSIRAWGTAIEEVKPGSVSADGRFAGPCLIYRKWSAMEISIASIPVDATVGVGRSYNNQEEEFVMRENETTVTETQQTARTGTTPAETSPAPAVTAAPASVVKSEASTVGTATPVQQAAQPEAIIRAERQRVADIGEICKKAGLDANRYIGDGSTVEAVRAAALEHLYTTRAPLDIGITKDEDDKFREAARDGLLLRGGIAVTEPAAGADNFRRLRLRDLMNYCARKMDIVEPELMQEEDLLRQFMTPSAAFPAIMDAAINKSYLEGYTQRPATFERWTARGSLSDFKPTRSYRWGQTGELLKVPEGGELKHDKIANFLGPDRQLETYGRQFTLTREAIINDDYEMYTKLPQMYGNSARRTRNRQVYRILSMNPVIYDGAALFSAVHGNLITPGTMPSRDALRAMLKRMMLMKDDEGNLIYVDPRYVLVPVGMAEEFEDILSQITINIQGGSVQSATNSLANKKLEIIEEAELNVGNDNGEFEWYLSADKDSVSSIQVDYLNGNEVPAIRRMEYPGKLGYIWDVYLDWGITVTDYRGLVKNEGERA